MKKSRIVLVFVLFVLIFSTVPQEVTAQTPPTCGYDSNVESILAEVTQEDVVQWIRNFSGEDFVPIGVSQKKILTRFSTQLFNLNVNALAYPYLGEQLRSFGYEEGTYLTDHAYTPNYVPTGTENMIDLHNVGEDYVSSDRNTKVVGNPDQTTTWKNKVVTIPGHGPNADEIVLMTAHMDSTSPQRNTNAPGAEDNASGVAALMEAARLFRFYKFDRTIKIIFFTGEEQGLWGSKAYVEDHPAEMDNIIGVVNLDMFGYDNDQYMCIELHVGTMPDSNQVGTCFTEVNTNYNLGLAYDYVTNGAIGASDHASFWDAGVGAIEVLENFQAHDESFGCNGTQDRNPHYHQITDTIDKMYMPATLATVKAGVGSVASLALPMGKCFATDPQITATPQTESIIVNWAEIEGADVYNVYRSTTSCAGSFTQVAQVSTNSYKDVDIDLENDYFYKVQAAETGAVCYSQMSNCAVARVEVPIFFDIFIPLVIAGE
jgi:leucyl aminopeptidase